MGFRFRKSIKAGPLRINFSKSGVGYSIGCKGFRYAKKAGGGTRSTANIPGTGISYVSETGKKRRGSNMSQRRSDMPSRNNSPKNNYELITETFRPVNISGESIKKLARLNPDWTLSDSEILASGSPGQKIYQIKFVNNPVQLLPESDNSIAVIVAGQKIGYVGADMNARISEILREGNIKKISCGIFGGQYKIIDDDFTIATQKAGISIIVRIGYTQPQAIRHRQKNSTSTNSSTVTTTEWLLCLLLGWVGGHKFYRKKIGMGILYLLTFGLFFIGWFGDAILLTFQRFGRKNESPVSGIKKTAAYLFAFVFVFLLGSCGGNSEADPNDIPTEPTTATSVISRSETTASPVTEVPTEIPTEEPTEAYITEVPTEAPTDPPETIVPTEAPTEPSETDSPTEIPAKASEPETPTGKEETEPTGTTYVLNTNTGKFHYPSCNSVDDIKEANKKEYTGTREEIIAMGYDPCGRCDP